VLTLDGMVELKVPQGIQHETMLLMRGRGVRELQVGREGGREGGGCGRKKYRRF
jgi:DnaJ-class molecular chaperone